MEETDMLGGFRGDSWGGSLLGDTLPSSRMVKTEKLSQARGNMNKEG
jgi:hypothetical protein